MAVIFFSLRGVGSCGREKLSAQGKGCILCLSMITVNHRVLLQKLILAMIHRLVGRMRTQTHLFFFDWRNRSMSKQSHQDTSRTDTDNEHDELNEYEEMELLERLESLREDMEDLGVTTLTEVIQRIDRLHHQLDTR